ncbi:MAG: YceI family protein [Bacteroidales bacterium]|nr:YceI family protein [Bacteroidales bacterium]
MRTLLLLALISSFLISGISQEYKVDIDNSTIKWTGKKVLGKHHGNISLLNGEFTLKQGNIIKGNFTMDMTSIICLDLTDKEWNNKLIGHLKSSDFFDVENHKTATFVITKAKPFINNSALVKGNITIKGITKLLDFEVKKEGDKYTALIEINRTEFDIRYGSGSFFDNLGDKAIDDVFTLEVVLSTKK